ncbi:MAG: PQQ-dependent sugar dehydrogenase [Limisphaerales bacterium]
MSADSPTRRAVAGARLFRLAVLRPAIHLAWCAVTGAALQAAPLALNTNLQIRLVMNTTDSTGAHSVRIHKDPRNNRLYYLKFNGDIYQVNLSAANGASSSTKTYTVADHGIANNAQGMAIGPDGTIYVVGNTTTNNGNSTFARIMKGTPDAAGARSWALLAQTEPYPLGRTYYDHLFNGITVSPDGLNVYLNSGARTDHGEVESTGGLYPNTRDVGLTAKIFRLPTAGTNLFLPNDTNALRTAGYIFAEGTRNTFDLAFAPNGDLFGTENGPDRDMSDSLLWLRPGMHYGFPWRMGGADNPQQFPNYDPSADLLLDPRFSAVQAGLYHNDPTFPPPPTNFAQPVINLGPDADEYRDLADGQIKRASSLGHTLSTFTAHRTPLGLVFDTVGAMAPPFQFHGFMLSWNPGDPTGTNTPGPFYDASQDLVDLDLTKLGATNYQARVTRIAGGFANPVDAEIIGHRIYVIEYGGDQGIWEVTFPPATTNIVLTSPSRSPDGAFGLLVNGAGGLNIAIAASTNLSDWSPITNLVPTNQQFRFTDPAAVHYSRRFYRVVLP